MDGFPSSMWWRDRLVGKTMKLFSGHGSDVYLTSEESGLPWEDYLFELQRAVEWSTVMARSPEERERAQMHSMS